jgi:putative transposase
VSRKKKGSRNRRKAVKRLRKVHARVKNLRREHHHQVALKLVRRYGFVAAERLNIRGMLRNGRLARAISDVAWGNFLLTLEHKAASAGVPYVGVDPRGTSQRCSGCGATVPKTLKDRWHGCPRCGLSLHRDENSAREILRLGLLARNGPVGAKDRVA